MDSAITATFMSVRVLTSISRGIAYLSAQTMGFNDLNTKVLVV